MGGAAVGRLGQEGKASRFDRSACVTVTPTAMKPTASNIESRSSPVVADWPL